MDTEQLADDIKDYDTYNLMEDIEQYASTIVSGTIQNRLYDIQTYLQGVEK